jgi:hypothetical protein
MERPDDLNQESNELPAGSHEPEADKVSGEITRAAGHENDKPETPDMEVHHHPHVEKKSFKEYLLEGLMIFLAVMMGFFAEGLREHLSEKEKAEVFAQSLYADYRADTVSLHQLLDYTIEKIKHIDSLEYCLKAPRSRLNDSLLYGTVLYLISTFQFDNINGTYEQIKNSGSLRFFNQSLVNVLNGYDATSLKLKLMEDWENKFLYEKVVPQTQEMFNYKVFTDFRNGESVKHEMYLKSLDEKSVDLVVNLGEVIKRLRERQLIQQKLLLQKATTILSGLKKEYNVKNE